MLLLLARQSPLAVRHAAGLRKGGSQALRHGVVPPGGSLVQRHLSVRVLRHAVRPRIQQQLDDLQVTGGRGAMERGGTPAARDGGNVRTWHTRDKGGRKTKCSGSMVFKCDGKYKAEIKSGEGDVAKGVARFNKLYLPCLSSSATAAAWPARAA